ncbi:MAG: thiol-disulfide isomerase, partial [Candidatus Kaiserbacteria bacterium]|nr:thiol-disulfide isomerase [Candidatus Kaiserbacteria bacterium]
YRKDGLVVIGVHTPEFAFEHVYKNVAAAVASLGIKYPVVLDNEYQTWNAYGNQFWPRKYLIDIDGYIVYDHIGEGNYDETEKAILHALDERALRLGQPLPSGDITPPPDAVSMDPNGVQSPETYFGSNRNEYLVNGSEGREGTQTLKIPAEIQPNGLYLGGTWQFTPEYATNISAGAQIRFLYSAKNVYFVASSDKPIKIKVTRDGGQPLGDERGVDVDANDEATIHEDRLYKLIEGKAYGVHTLEIQIEGTGLDAYTFTFG